MKKNKLILLLVCIVLIASSCTVTKPVYNKKKETLAQHQKDVKNTMSMFKRNKSKNPTSREIVGEVG